MDVGELYLDLLKKVLCRSGFSSRYVPVGPGSRARHLDALIRRRGLAVVTIADPEELAAARAEGHGWPEDAETMLGLKRLTNVQDCVRSVIADGVPGDLIETGVWRGGSTILMRACLEVYGDHDRQVWVADSFEGLPAPSIEEDAGDEHHTFAELAVSVDEVRANFEKYGLLDGRVQFLKGWFADTLPSAPIEGLAVLRLDGDMYSSTMDVLEALYPKLSPGGFCIIDDWVLPACRQAVNDYRTEHGIMEPIVAVDHYASFWRRDC